MSLIPEMKKSAGLGGWPSSRLELFEADCHDCRLQIADCRLQLIADCHDC